jgi:hypothetical protein
VEADAASGGEERQWQRGVEERNENDSADVMNDPSSDRQVLLLRNRKLSPPQRLAPNSIHPHHLCVQQTGTIPSFWPGRVIEHFVPSSLVAVAVRDRESAPSFLHGPLFQRSNDADCGLTTFTLRSFLHTLVSREQLSVVVSRYVSSFVLVVGAILT